MNHIIAPHTHTKQVVKYIQNGCEFLASHVDDVAGHEAPVRQQGKDPWAKRWKLMLELSQTLVGRTFIDDFSEKEAALQGTYGKMQVQDLLEAIRKKSIECNKVPAMFERDHSVQVLVSHDLAALKTVEEDAKRVFDEDCESFFKQVYGSLEVAAAERPAGADLIDAGLAGGGISLNAGLTPLAACASTAQVACAMLTAAICKKAHASDGSLTDTGLDLITSKPSKRKGHTSLVCDMSKAAGKSFMLHAIGSVEFVLQGLSVDSNKGGYKMGSVQLKASEAAVDPIAYDIYMKPSATIKDPTKPGFVAAWHVPAVKEHPTLEVKTKYVEVQPGWLPGMAGFTVAVIALCPTQVACSLFDLTRPYFTDECKPGGADPKKRARGSNNEASKRVKHIIR